MSAHTRSVRIPVDGSDWHAGPGVCLTSQTRPVESLNLRPTVLASGSTGWLAGWHAAKVAADTELTVNSGSGVDREGLDRGLVQVKAVTVRDLRHQQSVSFCFG